MASTTAEEVLFGAGMVLHTVRRRRNGCMLTLLL
jgi:hypothetical protein